MGLFDGLKKKVQEVKENRKEKKAAGNTIGQKIKKAGKKATEKVKNVGAKVKKKAMVALFTPLIPIAKKFLKRRGITPSNDTETLIVQMFNEQTKKSFGYSPEGYEVKDVFDYGYLEGEAGMVEQLMRENGFSAEYGLNDVVAAAGSAGITATTGIPVTPEMIQAVLTFLKNTLDKIKSKKAKGEPLSADEQEIFDQSGEIESELEEAKKKAQDLVNEDSGSNMKTIFIVLMLLLIAFFFFRR